MFPLLLVTLAFSNPDFGAFSPAFGAFSDAPKTDEFYIIQTEDPTRWNYASEIDSIPSQLKSTIHIRGPWHGGEATYATLAQPTRAEVKAALAKAKAQWAKEQVGRKAAPFALPDGTSKLPVGAVEALELVNSQRRERGLRPYIFDEGLTLAAANCAAYRAANRISGHCGGNMGDFAFLPNGSQADAAGCAAWDSGFGACGILGDYRFAGAAYVIGPNGLRFCHVFYRY